MDLALLTEQMENTIKYSDFPLLTKSLQAEVTTLNLHHEKYEHQVKILKQLVSQIDYQCLNKANKMDIEIQHTNYQRLKQHIQDQNEKIKQIIDQIDSLSCSMEQLITDQFSKSVETLKISISESVLQQLDQQLSSNFQKYDKMLLNYDKIQYLLETKADQSQFVEIMQTKVNQQQFQQIKIKQQDIHNHLKFLIEAILDFFEASTSETESINMKKSDMIKSINFIKTILFRLSPNDQIKQPSAKFNVKLKPTIFKTISHQRRIKTEMLD